MLCCYQFFLFIYMFTYLFSDQHVYTVLKIEKIGNNGTIGKKQRISNIYKISMNKTW